MKVVVDEALNVRETLATSVGSEEKGVLAPHLGQDSAGLLSYFHRDSDVYLLGSCKERGIDIGADANRISTAELRAEVELEPGLFHAPFVTVVIGAGLRDMETKKRKDDARIPNKRTMSNIFDAQQVGKELAGESVL